jgi:hypothetical protein
MSPISYAVIVTCLGYTPYHGDGDGDDDDDKTSWSGLSCETKSHSSKGKVIPVF